jgi:flagellar motor switch protein FliM
MEDIRRYPWERLARVDRRAQALLAAWAGRVPRVLPEAELPAGMTVRADPIQAVSGAALCDRVADDTALAIALWLGSERLAYAAVPAALARSLADAILFAEPAGDDDLGSAIDARAPRPATPVERGIALFAAAAVVSAFGRADVAVSPCARSPAAIAAELGAGPHPVVGVYVGVRGDRRVHLAWVFGAGAMAVAAPVRRPLPVLLSERGAALATAAVSARVIAGRGWAPLSAVDALRPRDVIVFDDPPAAPPGRAIAVIGGARRAAPRAASDPASSRGAGFLALGRGRFPIRTDGDRVIVTGPYERGDAMSDVADDVSVELSCAMGRVTLTAREVLELAPGQVLALDRPLGGPVELIVGRSVIGRGELVDLDGELGVRVVELLRADARGDDS